MTLSTWDLEKMYQQWDHGKTSNLNFEAVLADLLGLSKALIVSVHSLQNVIDSLVESERLRQEQV